MKVIFSFLFLFRFLVCVKLQGPAKKWETLLLCLGVAGSEPGVEGEEVAPLSKENVATP